MTTPPEVPLGAAEVDPDPSDTAALPGYSAGDRTTPQEASHPQGAGQQEAAGQPVGPPAQDTSGR